MLLLVVPAAVVVAIAVFVVGAAARERRRDGAVGEPAIVDLRAFDRAASAKATCARLDGAPQGTLGHRMGATDRRGPTATAAPPTPRRARPIVVRSRRAPLVAARRVVDGG